MNGIIKTQPRSICLVLPTFAAGIVSLILSLSPANQNNAADNRTDISATQEMPWSKFVH